MRANKEGRNQKDHTELSQNDWATSSRWGSIDRTETEENNLEKASHGRQGMKAEAGQCRAWTNSGSCLSFTGTYPVYPVYLYRWSRSLKYGTTAGDICEARERYKIADDFKYESGHFSQVHPFALLSSAFTSIPLCRWPRVMEHLIRRRQALSS